ncbi:MAG: hypothetical protein WBX18_14695 [Terracidiphilus sp.]
MADGKKQNLRLDEFTAKVVPDPKNPGKALCLTGFLGAASEPDQTRIYWDPSLTSYVDVANADILHSEPLPAAQSPLGGSILWVSSSAEVTAGSSGGQSAKGKFFEGPVMSAYGAGFGPAAGAAAAPAAAFEPPVVAGSYARGCWYSYDACPTMFGCGPHRTPACPMVEHAAGAAAAPAAAFEPPVVAGSYARGCWYSYDACPTMFGCGPHRTPACPMVAHAAAAPAAQFEPPVVAGSYARGCWYSYDACPTMFGCGPHRTPACPI